MARTVAIRLGTEGKAQIKADLDEIAGSGDATAKRWARSFERASDDVEAAMRRQANAASKIAVLVPGLNPVKLDNYAGIQTGTSKAAEESGAVFAAAFARMDRAAQSLAARYDPLLAAQVRYDEELARARTLLDASALSTERYDQIQRSLTNTLNDQKRAAEERAAAIQRASANTLEGAAGIRSGPALKSASDSASVFEQYYERLEARTRALVSAIDPAFAAQDRFNREMLEARELVNAGTLSLDQYCDKLRLEKQALDAVVLSKGKAVASVGQLRVGTQQLSYQISDVAASFASGTPLVTIFGQQVGQTVQAVQLMTGATSGFLGFLAGPWGALLTGGAVILAALANSYFAAAEKTDAATSAQKAQVGSVEALDAANKVLLDTLGQSIKTQGQVRAEAIGVANANLAAAGAARTRAIEEINLAKAMLAQTQARSRAGGDRSDLAASRIPGDMKAIQEQEKALIDLEVKINTTRRNRDRLMVEDNRLRANDTADRVDSEARVLAAAGKTGEAERALANIRKTGREELARGVITEAQYRDRIVGGEKALDAAREADRKHSNARQQSLARDAASMEVNAQASLDLARAYLAGGDAAMRAEAARKGLTDATKKGIDGDAQTQRQLAVMVGEQIANSAKSLSQMREETDARAALNAQVLAGALPAEQMSRALAEETALRPLLKLQTLAQGEALQVLTKVIDEYRAAFARKNAVEAEGTAIAAIDATKRRVADIKASILDMSLSPEQAAIAAARRQAEAEAKAGRFNPDQTRDLVGQRVAEATAQARANQARYIIDTLRGQEDAVTLAQRELQLVGANDNVRSAELEKLRIMLDIRRRFPEMAEQDVQAILSGVDAQAALKAELDRTTRSMEELRGFGVDFVDTVLSEDTWSSWGNAGKTILNMLRTEFIKLTLLNPLKNLINGNNDAPTLGGVLGNLGKIFGAGAGLNGTISLLTSGASLPGSASAIDLASSLPKLAAGTQHWSGGRALIGEMGQEIVDLPFGSRVIPVGETRRLLAGNDNAGPSVVNKFDLRGAVVTQDLLNQMNDLANGAAIRGAAGGAAMSQAEGDARAQRKLGRWR